MTFWQYGQLALELTVGSLAIFVLMNTGDRDYFVLQDYIECAVLTVLFLHSVLIHLRLMLDEAEALRARRALAEQEYGELQVQHPESVSSRATAFLTRLSSPISFDI
jgi:hypothetical protein